MSRDVRATRCSRTAASTPSSSRPASSSRRTQSGRIDDAQWALTFGINVTGAYIVADEAHEIFKQQGLPANLVLTTSANAVVAKKGSLAYDTSKAAANHLVRELAVEMAPLVRVNAVAPATVVKGSTMFPRDRVIASLAKYEIPFSEDESTEALRDKLAGFYAEALADAVADRAGRPGRGDLPARLAAARRRPPATSSRSTAGCRTASCGRQS